MSVKYLSKSELKRQRSERINRIFNSFNDVESFEEFIPKLIPNIERIAMEFVTDSDDRKDFCQDVLIKCLENKAKIEEMYNQKSNVNGWLYRFIRNKYLDQQKHEKVKLKVRPDDLIFDEVDLDVDMNRVKTLKDMMKELNSTERMWITQYIESGLNYEEFARRSKISNSKIKERILFILDKWKQLDIYLPR